MTDLHTKRRIKIDAIDHKILALLQEDATISIAEISERVHLSETPCWKRIRKLETAGVITHRVALLAPEKVGIGLTVLVTIETRDHSVGWIEKFTEAVAAMPEVSELYRMAGDVDYILRVEVADMAAYECFNKRLIACVSMTTVTSYVVSQRLKRSTAYHIPNLR